MLEGKVALITGAGRGQGRSHAVRFANEGADIVAVDVCGPIGTVPYALASDADLDETERLVRETGRRVVVRRVDVRDHAAMAAVASEAVAELGRIDVVCANAGIISLKPATTISPEDWQTVIDVNLTGTWNTISATLPAMLERDEGGSIVVTSSAAAIIGPPNMAHSAASKAGLLGMVRSLAAELGSRWIRVNAVAPTTVDTQMVHWPAAYRAFRPDLEAPTKEDVVDVFASLTAMGVPWIDPGDVTDAVLWLVSDEARHVTGIVLPVDAGSLVT